jgi:hypothetical protein
MRILSDVLVVILTVAVAAACTAGIVSSLKSTNSKGDQFWALIDQGASKVAASPPPFFSVYPFLSVSISLQSPLHPLQPRLHHSFLLL